jgi:hypothetical protein
MGGDAFKQLAQALKGVGLQAGEMRVHGEDFTGYAMYFFKSSNNKAMVILLPSILFMALKYKNDRIRQALIAFG